MKINSGEILAIFFLFTLLLPSRGQYEFKSLECIGEMPELFKKNYEELYEAQMEELTIPGELYSEKSKKNIFSKSSSYSLRSLLSSGYVLYGDTVSNYLNRVKDRLLENDTLNSKAIEVFTLKSEKVNAFTTHEGKIFVTIGLLSRLSSEAEIAFVLSHEITHYVKGHVFKGYVFGEKVDKEKTKTIKTKVDKFLRYAVFSKSQETEADEFGYNIFSKSPYKGQDISGVFDILKRSHLPLAELTISEKSFSSNVLQFESNVFSDTVTKIQFYNEDTFSTHPNCDKRKQRILNQSGLSHSDKGPNTASYSNFKKLASYELSRIYLKKRLYPELLYNNLVLENRYGSNSYLESQSSFAYYMLACEGLNNVKRHELETFQGAFSKFIKVTEKFKDKGVNLDRLIYNSIFKNLKSFEESPKDSSHFYFAVDLVQKKFDDEKDTLKQLVEKNKSIGTSADIEKIKFIHAIKESRLTAVFTQVLEFKQLNPVNEIDFEISWNDKRKDYLGIDSISYLEPMHMVYDIRMKRVFRPSVSYRKRNLMASNVERVGKKLDLYVDLYDSRNSSLLNTDRFNKLVRLIEFRELMRTNKIHDCLDHKYYKKMVSDIDASVLVWNEMVTIRKHDSSLSFEALFFSAGCYPIFPFVLYDALTPENWTYNVIHAYDIERGELLMRKGYLIRGRVNNTNILSNLYLNFSQIKGKSPNTLFHQSKRQPFG